MEVRLAAAQVIRGIVRAEGWTFIRHNGECKKFMAVGLCHLAGDCRDLSEKELAVSAIGATLKWISPTAEIEDIINSQILPPLIRLLDATSTETAIAVCRVLRKPLILKDEHGDNIAILQHLTPLLSHPDDEVFVEAAWTASVLTWHEDIGGRLPESFPLTTIQRLSRLLHHHNEHVVVCALHSIADSRCLEYVLLDFLLEMADEGVRRVISLMESSNLQVAEAALLVVHCFRPHRIHNEPLVQSVLRHFMKYDVIQVLLRILAWDSSHLFQEALSTVMAFGPVMNSLLIASTILHLIHLLPSLENVAKIVVVSAMQGLIWREPESTHLDPSIPRLLLQLAL
jgi:hypothetical protein